MPLPPRSIDVFCSSCGLHLYKYAKRNGTKSRLAKIILERIQKDFVGGRFVGDRRAAVEKGVRRFVGDRRAAEKGGSEEGVGAGGRGVDVEENSEHNADGGAAAGGVSVAVQCCPGCGLEFARGPQWVGRYWALKIIQGRVDCR